MIVESFRISVVTFFIDGFKGNSYLDFAGFGLLFSLI